MKQTLLVIAAIAIAFASCTKTKTNTVDVTVTKNDTTVVTDTVTYMPNLLGTWASSTGVSPIVFDTTTYTVQSYPAVPYIASPYIIYMISETNIVYQEWSYTISKHNDTLVLTTIATGVTNIYARN